MAMRENGSFPGHLARGAPGHIAARHAVRIGDTERDAAAHELGEHFVAGRLTLEELHDRLGQVLSARTRGQLIRVMADLPAFRRPRPAAPPGPAPRVPALAGGTSQGDQAGDGPVGRFAAVALLLVAMLIWLCTVLLFTRHGYYYPYHHHLQQPPWGQ